MHVVPLCSFLLFLKYTLLHIKMEYLVFSMSFWRTWGVNFVSSRERLQILGYNPYAPQAAPRLALTMFLWEVTNKGKTLLNMRNI